MSTLQLDTINNNLCIQKGITQINLAIFGYGLVGGTLINQIIASVKIIEKRKDIKLNIFAIANSTRLLLYKNGVEECWKTEILCQEKTYSIQDIINSCIVYNKLQAIN